MRERERERDGPDKMSRNCISSSFEQETPRSRGRREGMTVHRVFSAAAPQTTLQELPREKVWPEDSEHSTTSSEPGARQGYGRFSLTGLVRWLVVQSTCCSCRGPQRGS